jgi:hypothetical protein
MRRGHLQTSDFYYNSVRRGCGLLPYTAHSSLPLQMVMKLAKQTLKRLKQKWKYSTKMDKEIGCGYANWN